MAVVDNVTRKEITGNLGMEVVRCQATGATSTFVSKFGTIFSVQCTDETDYDCLVSWSGSEITITCTDKDYLNLVIFGR